MTFVIPTAVNQCLLAHSSDALRRGAFTEGSMTLGAKSKGSLPMSNANATQFINSSTTGFQGNYWAFKSSGGYDVSVDTKVAIIVYQYNAPNRLEIETTDNNGIVIRLGSGSVSLGNPPADYRTYQMGGQDSGIGKAREFPVHLVTDLNDSSHEALVGTYDNTEVQTIGFGSKTLNMGGTTTQIFFARMFVFDTVRGGDSGEASTDIPRFTGTSNWDDIIVAMGTSYTNKITHGWLAREGTVFSVACPLEFGNNSTLTNFNDNSVSVFWPDTDEPGNPRVRATSQAFRVYSNITSSDSITLTGAYNCGNSYPDWDFDQDLASYPIQISGATFKRIGTFLMGNAVQGAAIFDNCGVVICQDNGVDLDGSIFKNPHADHLLELAL